MQLYMYCAITVVHMVKLMLTVRSLALDGKIIPTFLLQLPAFFLESIRS